MAVNFGLFLTIFLSFTTVLSTNVGPVFNDAVARVHVVSGQTGTLPCSAQHKGSQHKIIWMNPKRILFSNEDQIVIDDPRIEVEHTYNGEWNLLIHHVRYNDSGEYTCQINTSPVKIKRVILYVQVPSHIINEDSSRDRDVEEGDTVELTCKATGVPHPNITWYRRPLQTSEGKDNLSVEGETLVIPEIQRYQSGLYSCLAYNNVPPAVKREMEIKVQYPPVVKVLNSRLGQLIGKETILECTVTSYPRAKIMWVKNGVPIQHSYKYRLELYTGDTYDTFALTLQILYINQNDFGDYTCEATNRMGIDKETMVLYEYREPTSRTTTVTSFPYTTTEGDYYYWLDTNVRLKDYVELADGRKYPTDKISYQSGTGHNKQNYGSAVHVGYSDTSRANSMNKRNIFYSLICIAILNIWMTL